jgi:hypothetical protein
MINNILNKTNILLGVLSVSILGNYKLYNENNSLKKEKSFMFELYRSSINKQIHYINKIKNI